MISKELLSEVLNNYNIEHFEIDDNYLWIQVDGGYLKKTINIYELANKCKEWAFKQTIYSIDKKFRQVCYIKSGFHRGYGEWVAKIDQIISIEHMGIDFESHSAKTEPEAIFKATSYIMEQLKQKD